MAETAIQEVGQQLYADDPDRFGWQYCEECSIDAGDNQRMRFFAVGDPVNMVFCERCLCREFPKVEV